MSEFARVRVPEPAVTDKATIAAHLAAFGSDKVRSLYEEWRFAATHIELEQDMLKSVVEELCPDGPDLDRLKHLREELHPREVGARKALADAVAAHLGHWLTRPPAPWWRRRFSVTRHAAASAIGGE